MNCATIIAAIHARKRAAALRLGGFVNSGHDSLVRAAPTYVAFHVFDYFVVARIGVPGQQRSRRHDHTGRAVAALHRVRFNKRLLHRMQPAVLFQSLNRGYSLADDGANGGDARAGRFAVDQDRARSALSFAAAVLASGEIKVVTQYAKQASVAFDVDSMTS